MIWEQTEDNKWCFHFNDRGTLSHHKHISSSDVFVHHKPGVSLPSYLRPLAQRQSEPAWMDRDKQEHGERRDRVYIKRCFIRLDRADSKAENCDFKLVLIGLT